MHTRISGLYVPGVSIHSIILDLIVKNPVVQLSSTPHSFKNSLIHSFSFLGFSKCGPRSLHKSHPFHLTMLYKSAHALSVVSPTSTDPSLSPFRALYIQLHFIVPYDKSLRKSHYYWLPFTDKREFNFYIFLVRLLHQIIAWKYREAASTRRSQPIPCSFGPLVYFHQPWECHK